MTGKPRIKSPGIPTQDLKTMHEKAMDKARDILKNHKPTPLSDQVRSEMRSIVENCEGEILERKARQEK